MTERYINHSVTFFTIGIKIRLIIFREKSPQYDAICDNISKRSNCRVADTTIELDTVFFMECQYKLQQSVERARNKMENSNL